MNSEITYLNFAQTYLDFQNAFLVADSKSSRKRLFYKVPKLHNRKLLNFSIIKISLELSSSHLGDSFDNDIKKSGAT